jgi:signal transduction histidine kinase
MIVTAYSDLDAILGAVNRGLVSRYIVKPWDADAVRRMLRWGLDAYALGLRSEALQARLLEVERVATVGTVASAILHDVSGPLGYLSLNTERLISFADEAVPRLAAMLSANQDEALERAVRPLVEELPEMAAEMEHGCATLLETVAEVRRLLHAEERGPQATDPLPAIRYALSVTRELTAQSRVQLTYDGPETLPVVTIGFASLVRVLINLISNAALAVATTENAGRVWVDASRAGDQVSIRVRDDGPGMSAEVLAKVGTPLFTTRPGGTGLGVSQCLRLVAGAGGRMNIDSVEGEGTVAAISLPICPDRA